MKQEHEHDIYYRSSNDVIVTIQIFLQNRFELKSSSKKLKITEQAQQSIFLSVSARKLSPSKTHKGARRHAKIFWCVKIITLCLTLDAAVTLTMKQKIQTKCREETLIVFAMPTFYSASVGGTGGFNHGVSCFFSQKPILHSTTNKNIDKIRASRLK